MKSKQKARVLLVTDCMAIITRKQGSKFKGSTYSRVADIVTYEIQAKRPGQRYGTGTEERRPVVRL
jgi:hypothetical protein